MRRLRTRMVVAFVIVALLPAVPLSILVRSLLERSFGPPLGDVVEDALVAALAGSRERLREAKAGFRDELNGHWAPQLREGDDVSDFGALPAPEPAAGDSVRAQPAQTMVRRVLPRPPAEHVSAEAAALLRWAEQRLGEDGAEDLVGPERIGSYLAAILPAADGRHVLFVRPLPSEMVARAEQVVETIALMRAFEEERSAVVRGYVLPFVLFYVVLLIVAAGVAVFLARRIARPVEALAAGARGVGAGDLDVRVEAEAAGEVGELVSEFNRMVTDLAAQRSELARLERLAAWRDFARGLAHEIKNPLTPIQLAVQQLADQYAQEGAAGEEGAAEAGAKGEPVAREEYAHLLHECVEIVNEEVGALRKLVREFSEFARLPEPVPAWGDVAGTLGEIGRLYGERVAWTPPDGKLRCRFDEEELRRALINLIDNGLAACREAGREERVELTAHAAGDEMRIEVADRGCGIPAANLERIFAPDFSTKKEGMGLGLAIVEGIVRGHGGTLYVESVVGEGTRFTIHLPVAGPPPAAGSDSPPPTSVPPGGGSGSDHEERT
jgi:two-component system nitrogen regulation sensor histidine kinase NtrY